MLQKNDERAIWYSTHNEFLEPDITTGALDIKMAYANCVKNGYNYITPIIIEPDGQQRYGQTLNIKDSCKNMIKNIRAMTGLTQKDFAEKYYIPKRTLENWESSTVAVTKGTPLYIIMALMNLVESEHYCRLFPALILYHELNVDFENCGDDLQYDYLTLNTARSGREVMWYLDDTECKAIYTDTLEFLTEEEIDEELT